VIFGKQGRRLSSDPKANAESQHTAGRPAELSRCGYVRQSHMRNKAAPAQPSPCISYPYTVLVISF